MIVKLGADIDLETSSIKTKCAMRLDLNGHTLSGGGSTVIEAMYNLTVVDTGTTKAQSRMLIHQLLMV